MLNLHIKNHLGVSINPSFEIGGSWNVAIVDENNKETFPFGSSYKKNLILDQALDILSANNGYGPHLNLNWNTIPSFLKGNAVLGTGIAPAQASDTNLTYQTLETNVINDESCSVEDFYSLGKRVFKKVYDFPKPETLPMAPTSYTLSEIGLKNGWNGELFTKFLLDSPILIPRGQWLRLFYNFSISCSAIVNPININLSSGTFNANGWLKLVGRFDDIFGSFDLDGNPVIRNGDSPRSSFMPFCDEFCAEIETCTNKCFGTAYLLTNFFENENSINSTLFTNWLGNRLSVANGTINPSNYTQGNFYRDIEYVFDINNPTANETIGGFLFTTVKTNRQNTVDGWLWKLNNPQIKRSDKKIVINLRQSMARI